MKLFVNSDGSFIVLERNLPNGWSSLDKFYYPKVPICNGPVTFSFPSSAKIRKGGHDMIDSFSSLSTKVLRTVPRAR